MSRRITAGRAFCASLLLLAATSLATARGFAETPPKGVDLNGTWTLNVALSDDPKKILEAERAKRRGRDTMTMLEMVEGPQRHGDGKRRPMPRDENDQIDMPAQVTLVHAADRFSISTPAPSGDMRKAEYRAGARSVVSVANGVADRESGWKGKGFVISTRAVEGVNREDRYSLDKDGRLLVVTETRGRDIPKREVKRVYDRAAN